MSDRPGSILGSSLISSGKVTFRTLVFLFVALQDSFQVILSCEYLVAAPFELVFLGRTETNIKLFLFLLTSKT